MTSSNQVPLGAFSVSIAQMKDNLRAILDAVDDPNIDCEEIMKIVKGNATEAEEHLELMRRALL